MKLFHFLPPSLLSRTRTLAALVVVIGTGLLQASSLAAEPPFTRQLSPEDFAAAGLNKLTPAERERLDALIARRGSEDLSQARAEANRAKAERALAETKAAEAAAKAAALAAAPTPTPAPAASAAPRAGWLSKVTLKPGTAVEYETVETALVGDFSGWSVGTLFTLSNGQRWRVVNGSYVAPKDSTPRKVRIVPGVLGSFFLEIEGIRSRPKVAFAGAAP